VSPTARKPKASKAATKAATKVSSSKATAKADVTTSNVGDPAPSSPLPAVSPDQLALRPRPGPAPEALAVIAAATQLLWTRPAAPEAPQPAHDAWRFSGRWWAQPALVRRSRPWARP
jgi:hypothetical protein